MYLVKSKHQRAAWDLDFAVRLQGMLVKEMH